LIYGCTKEEHDINLEIVVSRIKEYGLEENVSKMIESKEEVSFLGYEIGFNKIRPKVDRAQGILDYPVPIKRKQLQKFLGMINYNRMFIDQVTELLKPLYGLLAKDVRFVWTEQHNKCFDNIKEKWKTKLELLIPDPEGYFVLKSDASDVGLGAVLKQNEKAVAHISRCLTKSEKKLRNNR
jgi:hypothetical protein